jgi:thiamine pyrophosphate-dependent acetolactate synthase large subunit-like protein
MSAAREKISGMPVVDALRVLIEHCDENWIVVTNQGSARIWPKLVRRPRDLHYNPSTMGGAVSLALGLALAQPKRRVLCVTGDGALLMNLGSLVTVAACAPKNLVICVLDNRLYEVTGGQRLPAATLLRRGSGCRFRTGKQFRRRSGEMAGGRWLLPQFARPCAPLLEGQTRAAGISQAPDAPDG